MSLVLGPAGPDLEQTWDLDLSLHLGPRPELDKKQITWTGPPRPWTVTMMEPRRARHRSDLISRVLRFSGKVFRCYTGQKVNLIDDVMEDIGTDIDKVCDKVT